jgi:hypothetical protein
VEILDDGAVVVAEVAPERAPEVVVERRSVGRGDCR